MRILVINGDCIQTNTSANLCHMAYLRGLVDCGHEVTLLSADGRDYSLDPAMSLPEKVKSYTYYGTTLYEKLSLRKKQKTEMSSVNQKECVGSAKTDALRRRAIHFLKKRLLALYGVHGIYSKFVRVAQRFRSNEEYDCVLSLSTPVTSHLIAQKLIKSGHIRTKKWIQVWEDPWFSDAYGFNSDKKVYKEEKKLLSFAENVCYVSPITLQNQQKLFPESAEKMYWQPLPYYYKYEDSREDPSEELLFGYFGNYYPAARNLEPFYRAAVSTGIHAVFCGEPSGLFEAVPHLEIYPRLNLEELKPIEERASVLIFLCNRKGGQIPGKIYQYSATNKVILFILDGTAQEKKIIREYFEPFQRFIFCENTEEDIIRAIRCIERKEFGNIKNEPVEAFNPAETIRKVLEGKEISRIGEYSDQCNNSCI